ncbi:probable Sno-type pyridoxine vitamin B6 biosynthetic protein SNO1 [Cephalotrichum gorgonifer]|uniref:glutaminase n=1 Tax=Cephalotrichum gorgonifer TaxID=2041049 RepID=A0AAE8SW90_9PEZI|nr:probable Sno-type pyridoxine vitamin B6 biosynthetic protein SNO1 [Cephalotrichum gorgonifer]
MSLTVGVLALQGGFQEHVTLLRKAADRLSSANAISAFSAIEVRTPEQLGRCDALVIPGGESTTISLIATQTGMMEPLREFVKTSRKPIWGTCAGMILLADEANATKKGGQELIGGLAVRVRRNHFGRQIESFVSDIELPFLSPLSTTYPGVFIRAPIVEEVLAGEGTEGPGERVEVMAVLPGRLRRGGGAAEEQVDAGHAGDVVAVRQGNIFGTSFHPELTSDERIHVWWLGEVILALGR